MKMLKELAGTGTAYCEMDGLLVTGHPHYSSTSQTSSNISLCNLPLDPDPFSSSHATMCVGDQDEHVKSIVPLKQDVELYGVPYQNWQGKPLLSRADCTKVLCIRDACKAGNRHLISLLATSSDGLIDDEVRREACTS